jgi:hypothetical protein
MTQTNQSLQDPQNLEATRSYLNDLVGEGKRYQSPEELARAKYHADSHIKQVEAENARLREDYTRAREENIAKAKLEELLDQIQNPRKEQPTEHTQPIVREEKAIDPKQIESLIDNKLKQVELTRTYNQNLESVKNKLIERYGENYTDSYKQQIEQLDLSKEEADDMARRKPTTFLKMLGIDQPRQVQQQYTPPPRTNTSSTQNPVQQPTEKRTWAWYENLRKTNKTAYLDPKIQVQMLQDRMELGNAFEDSGFDVNLGGTR